MKWTCADLDLVGTSVLFSSGDNGVAGNGGKCINGTRPNAPYQNGTFGGRFNPTFPATCPYVTAVGATQIKNHTNILTCQDSEEACQVEIRSGGGFSNVFAMPSYQASAVRGYFQDYSPPYSAARYNNSQNTRGFPDVAVNGAKYVVAINGGWDKIYGTSCSTPTLAAILTLINEERYNAAKSSIGFINPVAYAFPYMFKDITAGGNRGCNTPGFSSVPGWDPVTGLGTPRFPVMKEVFLSLPGGNGRSWRRQVKARAREPGNMYSPSALAAKT